MKKKVLSLLLASTMVVSLAACGGKDSGTNAPATSGNDTSSNTSSNTTGSTTGSDANAGTSTDNTATGTEATSDIEKPSEITIMVDGTVFTQPNARDEFIAKLEELTGIKINVIQPDHDAYYDVVGQRIAGGDWPDVLILAATQLSSYGSEGVLWDMSSAWENSDLKKRQEAYNGAGVVESMYINGALYGMPATHGNGCVTYVKKAWMDAAGITSEPTTFDEYYDMLLKVKEAKGVESVVAAPGFMAAETPYINYLPEFYQDAWPSFYQKEDGTWADGFEEDSMKAAMERIAKGVADGVIDKTSLDAGTKDVRNKFYEDSLGVFTYWAGTWASNLKNNLETNGVDSELVAIKPIKETGAYIDRVSPAWCITSTCKNPEGVFKYFIEAMQDGGDIQFLWTYGVEGIHWSTKAETLYAGTDNEKTYAEGEFHMLDNLETPGTQYTKAHIDPNLALVELANDPRETAVAEEAKESQLLFNSNSVGAFIVPATDELNQYNGDLMSKKKELVAKVALGEMTIEQAYESYESEGYADMSKLIVDSLNAQ